MSQLAFLFDQRYCIGCQACQTACQVKNTSPVGISLRHATSFEEIPEGPFLSLSCNHCENPACVLVCEKGAVEKNPDTGIVSINKDMCDGCGACAEACPYGAPVLNPETSKMDKCDFCKDLIEAGELPACVRACPVKVLTFGELADLDAVGAREAEGFTYEISEPAIRFVV